MSRGCWRLKLASGTALCVPWLGSKVPLLLLVPIPSVPKAFGLRIETAASPFRVLFLEGTEGEACL